MGQETQESFFLNWCEVTADTDNDQLPATTARITVCDTSQQVSGEVEMVEMFGYKQT